MALTDDELRRLHEIETVLGLTDRRLARTLANGRPEWPWLRAATTAAGAVAFVVGGAGIALQLPALCLIGWFAMLLLICLLSCR